MTRSEGVEKSWTDVAGGQGVVRMMRGGPDLRAGIEGRRTFLAGVAELADHTCCGHVARDSGKKLQMQASWIGECGIWEDMGGAFVLRPSDPGLL